MTTTRDTNQTLKEVLDRTFVPDCTFDAIPVFDENGKLVVTVPNTEQRAYDLHDRHRAALTDYLLRINRRVKAHILMQRQGSRMVPRTVGRHPICWGEQGCGT